ncbi:MAG: leucyl aminopeptidase [Alphaproteobacteria bacterium CG11_big_fil_rev_8_21_14_0_20_44_7]|nr:MAG: leucyl aminopeptidase [Alphaproteobacteria bacterium CG11_big_fil_rev_8_21_14_0_20_44_7]
MDIKFEKIAAVKSGVLVVPVHKGGKLDKKAAELDSKSGGSIKNAIKNSSNFKNKNGECISVLCPHLPVSQVILVGVDLCKENPEKSLKSIGGKLVASLNHLRIKSATILLEDFKPEEVANIAYGAKLKSYDFGKYFTTKEADEKPCLTKLSLQVSDEAKTKKAYKDYEIAANAIEYTRNLVTEPSNVLNPESYAAEIKKLSKSGLKIEVLGEAAMKKLGMNALLGVGQGSAFESQLVVMKWEGGKKGDKPVSFVGKGVTFDTGGISIKPSAGMEEMKFDMGGSAVVVGLMKLLAERKAKVNVIGVVGLVENMPSSTAQRPGDVVKSMSGQTIEVLNTDAEGRLVLADALHYTVSKFKPKFVIDLATLTGAILVALGSSRAGLFSNDDKLSEKLFELGKKTGDEVWRLPLGEVYDKQINSEIADMQNIGTDREAGSITAAQFLQRFVNKTPWVHLDIAGTAWSKKGSDTAPKGATGWGVSLLNELVKDYEK